MIIKYPNKILRQKSTSLPKSEITAKETAELLIQMKKELKSAGGVGLAAVQIGVLKRVILVETEDGVKTFINPRIIKKSFKKIHVEEGCLSIPNIFGHVKRSFSVNVSALNEQGKKINIKVKGLQSIIIQHEIDHINGVLFIDKIMKKEPNNLDKLPKP